MITAPQIRAARAFLDWSREDLEKKSGISVPTIARIESRGPEASAVQTVSSIKEALERSGISFTERGIEYASQQ